MSAFVYDVGYDNRMIKKKKNMVTGCYKRKKKYFARHRLPKNIKILKHAAIFKL